MHGLGLGIEIPKAELADEVCFGLPDGGRSPRGRKLLMLEALEPIVIRSNIKVHEPLREHPRKCILRDDEKMKE